MRALYMIIAVTNIYMFVFVAGRSEFGTGRPILAAAYFVLAILWAIEFAFDMRSIFQQKKQTRGEQLKERLRKDGNRTKG